MYSLETTWSRTFLRAAIVAGSVLLVGFVLFPSMVFVPTMRAWQFTESSITAGLAYAGFNSSSKRNALAALFVWYIILLLLMGPFHRWVLVLNLVYIGGIASAIYGYNFLVKKPVVHTAIQRILVAGGLVAIANGLIIIVLGLILFSWMISHLDETWMHIVANLQFGALIGLAMGVGIELAEYVLRQFVDSHIETEQDHASADDAI
jgi:hypothetical protein